MATQTKDQNDNNKNYYYSTMANKANDPVQLGDGEQVEQKADIHQSLGAKKMQEDFDQTVVDLFTRLQTINEQVVDLNRTLNQRNNSIVQDVTSIIHDVLHETNEVS